MAVVRESSLVFLPTSVPIGRIYPSLLRAVLLIALAHCVRQSEGGVCWYSVTKSGLCRRPYKVNVTKLECCNIGVASMSWTPHDNPSNADIFFWEHLRKGASQCQVCHKTCNAVKCQSNKKCVMKRGRPKCICKRKCSKRHRRSGILCGNDGRTYKSECHLLLRNCKRKQNIVPSYKGRCRQSCRKVECLDNRRQCLEDQNGLPHCVLCKKTCPQGVVVSPLCGEDSVTYPSLCHLRQAVCRKGRAIRIAYRGTCRKNATCFDTECPNKMKCLVNPLNSQPQCEDCQRECSPFSKKFQVCGTDDVTYSSYCELRKASCRMGISLSTKRAGKCKRRSRMPRCRHCRRRRRRKKERRKHKKQKIRIKLKLDELSKEIPSLVQTTMYGEKKKSQRNEEEFE